MEDILHKIRVHLYENLLTEDPNDYSAKVVSERSLGVKEICQTAVKRGGAASTAEAMEHNVALFLKEMAYQLMDGYAVNTGYFTANAQIRGVFNDAKESFDPKKHSLLFRFNQGEMLRKEIPNVAVQVLGVGETGIMISHVIDSKTGSVNDLLTPNGTLKIKGGKLKIVGDNPQIGVCFEKMDKIDEDDDIPAADRVGGAVYKVDGRNMIVNNPSELIVEIPPLAAGKYRLVIRNQYGGNSQQSLKTLRETVFERILTVQ